MKVTYQHHEFEPKWQKAWEDAGLFQQSDAQDLSDAEKEYLLFAFAYPSGSGLHVGHVESKTALDILARFRRMQGKKVFFPVGWDAFGLPAENYAIKTGVHPAVTTKNAIDTFRSQIKRLGISYDWANELATNHPGYYQWTQWIFLQLYKKGLAYRGVGMVNWCPSCQTVLANEQVVNGKCERCGTQVVQKELEQWYFGITKYQDELISGLDQVDWPRPTKEQQLHWIGKSKGLNIEFSLQGAPETKLAVWTKFWETIYGVTFVVIAPEKFNQLGLRAHLAKDRIAAVEQYLEESFKKTEEERQIGEKNKTGVDTGLQLVNPVNGQAVPLYIADYVLMNVGTGVVMGVPAHDERDFAFAVKYDLPRVQVVSYADAAINDAVQAGKSSHEGDGTLINSGQFDGLSAWGEGKAKMAEWMIAQAFASWQTTYKLRDWLISRQRYWGAPIPIVYDPEGKPHPVKTEHLPWCLPTDVDFKPTGESPLRSSREFIERTEKLYGKGWRPECDTMDTFVDSSWYFLRYIDSRNTKKFAEPAKLAKWLPVDLYLIGPEHIVLHLLYARFFTKFLRDEGYLKFDEPFMKMRHQGMILGPDGKKMSKSKGNVITPDSVIEKFGADTLRTYEMFMGPLEADKPWDTGSVIGIYRFLHRAYQLVLAATGTKELQTSGENSPNSTTATPTQLTRRLHQTIRKVTLDLPELKFNTAISALMIFVNEWESAAAKEARVLGREDVTNFIKLLAPFAPFLAEELYQSVQGKNSDCDLKKESVHVQLWPNFDQELAAESELTIVVQVNGKVRGEFTIPCSEKDAKDSIINQAKKLDSVQKWIHEQQVKKEIYVPGRLVNLVVG